LLGKFLLIKLEQKFAPVSRGVW